METSATSAVIPTRHRPQVLKCTLESLLRQGIMPVELIVVDASDDLDSKQVVESFTENVRGTSNVRWIKAAVSGAAAQRNQGVAEASQPVIWFLDDDILLEPECTERLWAALHSGPDVGGANAMITNQKYQAPGRVSRLMFRLMAGEKCRSYAGRVLGPAVNLLPEDCEDLPEFVSVEWLNTTCTMYRREALPDPPFPPHFTGYSLMEDVTLSVTVGKKWKLVNARTARIFHDSQPGTHKSDPAALSEMELINRHYVMTKVLGRRRLVDYFRLIFWEVFQLVASMMQAGSRRQIFGNILGKSTAVARLLAA